MRPNFFKWSLISFVLGTFGQTTSAKEYFDPSLLQAVNGEIPIADTTEMSKGFQPAGVYRVTININQKKTYIKDIRFELNKQKELYPCLTYSDYKKFGINIDKILANAKDNALTKKCVAINDQVQDAVAELDFSKLELNISIPQIDLIDETVNGVPQEEWDDGIPALLMQYQ
ncbi:FimD/PapC N-terminal domain-containing protein, partial [Enterobacter cloacae complex sp. P6RS]|uniref:FimD/PapC N-terminal domain-containing protein n=2 Tax=unclassified Enterobacter cloacae complex TaxID=2757714 RepID=UPI001876CC43